MSVNMSVFLEAGFSVGKGSRQLKTTVYYGRRTSAKLCDPDSCEDPRRPIARFSQMFGNPWFAMGLGLKPTSPNDQMVGVG